MNSLKERMAEFDPIILTPCQTCKHRLSGFTCKAFPRGIPQVILTGENDHQDHYTGDGGVIYESSLFPYI